MSKRPGPKSKFTGPQDAFIAGFFPELWTKYSTQEPRDVTSWKKTKIMEIMASPLFAGQLAPKGEKNGTDEKDWRGRILKKFNAYITARTTKDTQPSGSWLQFEPLTALKLFELEKSATILAAARLTSHTGERMCDRLEACRQEMWEALDSNAQADYERRAKVTPPSVSTNQADFPRAAARALNSISRGGLVGTMELLLFWAYRDEAGDLHYGTIDAHPAENARNMADETDDWEASFESPWMEFAEKTIPRSSTSRTDVTVPRNASGIPIFPTFDMKKHNAEAVTQILERYLNELWAHANKTEAPWDAIAAEGTIHYDASRFALPFQLKAPHTLTTAQTFALAEYFTENSGPESDDPFMFRSDGGELEDDGAGKAPAEDFLLSEGDGEGAEGAEALDEHVSPSEGDDEVAELRKNKSQKGEDGKTRSLESKPRDKPAQRRHTGSVPRDRRVVESATKKNRLAGQADESKVMSKSKNRSPRRAPEGTGRHDEIVGSQTEKKRKRGSNSEMRAQDTPQDQGPSRKRVKGGAPVVPVRIQPDRSRSQQPLRPPPPHRTGRPGWDYALERGGNFVEWAG